MVEECKIPEYWSLKIHNNGFTVAWSFDNFGTAKKNFLLKAYNSLQQKYHIDIFHYFENRLGKDSDFRKQSMWSNCCL